MAPELSSNWKKLQAQLKAAGPSSSSTTPAKTSGGVKRKAESSTSDQQQSKKKKIASKTSGPATHTPKAVKTKNGRMGVAQSSKVEVEPKVGPSPSLALWAQDNDISSEALAEAYGLGLKNNSMLGSEKDKINSGLIEGIEVGKYIAIDCEMVGVGDGGYESVLARVSIVDFHGRQVYDSYVKPQERVTDWRSAVSGILPKHMRFARDFDEVQKEVAALLKDRIVVAHDIKHDLDCLKLSHPSKDIRDTAKHPGFRQYGNGSKPALRRLAEELLKVTIQGGAHSSIEDARVTMLLFRKHKSAFDVDHANRFPRFGGASISSKPKSNKSKKKK